MKENERNDFDSKEEYIEERHDNVRIGEIMTKNVIMVTDDVNVRESIEMMVNHNITNVIVKPADGNPDNYGIITERDIIRKVTLADRNINTLKAADIKTFPLVRGNPRMTILECVNIMRDYGIKQLPVFDKGNLAGIATLSDILAFRSSLFRVVFPLYLVLVDRATGILQFEYKFSGSKYDLDEISLNLFSGAITSISMLISESLNLEKEDLHVLQKEKVKLIFEYGRFSIAVLILKRSQSGGDMDMAKGLSNTTIWMRKRTARFLKEFEVVFGKKLVNWAGECSQFEPAREFLEEIFL